MTSITRKSLAIAAFAVTAVFGLAACSSPAPTVESTPQSSPAAEAEPEGSALLSAEDFAERIAAAQLAAGSAQFETSMQIEGEDVQAKGEMVFSDNAEDLLMGMTMEMPGLGEMEMRFVDGLVYLGMGELTAGKFIEIDPANATESGEGFTDLADGFLEQYGSFDAYAEALRDFSVADETVTIDGVETYVYTLVLDTESMMELEGVDMDAAEEAGLGETVEYEFYVGLDDLPRRIVSESVGGTVTMSMSAWGEPVSVEAPAADDILDGSLFGF